MPTSTTIYKATASLILLTAAAVMAAPEPHRSGGDHRVQDSEGGERDGRHDVAHLVLSTGKNDGQGRHGAQKTRAGLGKRQNDEVKGGHHQTGPSDPALRMVGSIDDHRKDEQQHGRESRGIGEIAATDPLEPFVSPEVLIEAPEYQEVHAPEQDLLHHPKPLLIVDHLDHQEHKDAVLPVSYTHLTLPTNREV